MRPKPTTSADAPLPMAEIALFWIAVALCLGVSHWGSLDETFTSPDNAMRLVEIRAFLDGAPWFDPHEPRLAPPQGYDTHWSRLIDAGLSALIILLRQLVAPDLAERLARCIWPLMLSGTAVAAAVAAAVRLGGAGAGRATLVSALFTLALLPTVFRPGEIDHHNAQVAVALTLIAAALWCDRRYLATAAGVAGGALLGIGLEAAHVLAAVAATLGFLTVYDHAWGRSARAFGSALAVATSAAYLALTPSALRFIPQCDALAINSAAAVVVGAVGLAGVASLGEGWPRHLRFLALAIAGGAAFAVYVAIEPRCLKGPFGLIDRSIFPMWLDHVLEMQGLPTLVRLWGPEALVYVGFPAVALASVIFVTGRARARTPLVWAPVAAFAISVLVMTSQIRMIIYVIWLGLPFVGALAQHLAQRASQTVMVRVAAAALLSPPIVTFAMTSATSPFVEPMAQAAQTPQRIRPIQDISACVREQAFRTLAALPPGLVMAPLDLGPAVLLHTPHSVVAAPYHRAVEAIRFNEEVMNGSSAAAETRSSAVGVDYIVACNDYPARPIPNSFHNALLAGAAGKWLKAVSPGDNETLRVWRVRR